MNMKEVKEAEALTDEEINKILQEIAAEEYAKEKNEKKSLLKSSAERYNNALEGYAEYLEPKKRGAGLRRKYIYVGKYYYREYGKIGYVKYHGLLVLLWLAEIIFYLVGTTSDLGCNRFWLVEILEAVCIIFHFWIFIGIIRDILAGKRLKIAVYKKIRFAFPKTLIYGEICSILLVLAAIFAEVFVSQDKLLPAAKAILSLMLSSACIIGQKVLSSVAKYVEEQNPIAAPINSHIIKNDEEPDYRGNEK